MLHSHVCSEDQNCPTRKEGQEKERSPQQQSELLNRGVRSNIEKKAVPQIKGSLYRNSITFCFVPVSGHIKEQLLG